MQPCSFRAALSTLVFSFLLAATTAAQGADKAAADIDPQVSKVVAAWGKHLQELQGFDVAINIEMHVAQGANSNDIHVTQRLQAERPDKLTFTLESGPGGGELVSNGEKVTIFFKTVGKYLVQDVPADQRRWDSLLTNPLAAAVLNGGNAAIITGAMLAEDPAAKLLANTTSATYGGEVMLGDVKCHLIKVAAEEADWQLWIDAGDKPVVRQFVPDLNKVFAKMAKGPQGNPALANLKVTSTVEYKNWQENPQFAADAFVFKAPEGTVQIEDISELRGGAAEGPHPLLAKPAPGIKLDLLGGGKLDLAALKDKNVVILDFWATWCGPCQRAMPVIEKVAAEYKEKGVLLYAVNIQEAPEDVQKFLDDSGLKLPIALDKEGDVARAYQANAIPQTVLVGKDGTVQAVHVGLLPNLEEQLKKELDTLVAGKELATAKAKTAKDKPAAAEASDK